MNPAASWFCVLCAIGIVAILYLNHHTGGKWLKAKEPLSRHYWYSADVGRVQTPQRGEKGTRWIEDGSSLSNERIAQVAQARGWGVFRGDNAAK
jgi:hypothetical protein